MTSNSGVAALCAALCMTRLSALASPPQLPTNGQFVGGNGTIQSTGNQLSVNQNTARGIINWSSFSIGKAGSVQVNNGRGATLNRVTGADPSQINGALRATGSLYLINPQGVVIGPGGKVVAGGSFVASTRDVSNGAFMAGGPQFFQGNSAGAVTNAGSITAETGDAVLIGRAVTNTGKISAPGGTVGLAAGGAVLLRDAGSDGRLLVEMTPGTNPGDVTQTGVIKAVQAELNAVGGNVYALAGNRKGLIKATGTETRAGGVWLTAGQSVEVSGTIVARNADRSGGTIAVTGGAAGGSAAISGRLDVRGTGKHTNGGTVTVTANRVTVSRTARLDASGTGNGGTILLGGDRGGGANPTANFASSPLANAQYTTVQPGAIISADGGSRGGGGTGGNVVIWSDMATSFAGAVSAKGGQGGGDGGFAEISSHGVLSETGTANLTAPGGATGKLLLDPANIVITCSGVAAAGTSVLCGTQIEQQLGLSAVTIATGSSATVAGSGDITVLSPITWSSDNALTLSAYHDVAVSAPIESEISGDVTLQADNTGSGAGTVSFKLGGSVSLAGGQATIFYNPTPPGLPTDYTHPTDYSLDVTGGSVTAYMLVNNTTQLQDVGVQKNLGGAYALGRNIDASALSDFTPIGNLETKFTGLFNGEGYTIDRLTINQSGSNPVGLFGALSASAVVSNVGVTNVAVTGTTSVGALVGDNSGTVSDTFSTGTVVASSVSTGAVVASTTAAGGLVGTNQASGSISASFSSAQVQAGDVAGGLLGLNYGSIDGSFSTGKVTGAHVGGLVGRGIGTDTVFGSYWDTQSSGVGTSAGGTRKTTAQLQSGLPAVLSAKLWGIKAGQGYPYLLPFTSSGPPPATPTVSGGVYTGPGGAALGGAAVTAMIDGTSLGSVTTQADGKFSFAILQPLFAASGSDFLSVLSQNSVKGNTLVAGLTGGTGGLSIYGNTLQMQTGASSYSGMVGELAHAAGSTVSSDFLFALGTDNALSLTAGANLELITTAASLTVDRAISTTGTLALATNGTVTQTTPITAGGMALVGSGGSFVLTNTENRIDTLAAAAGAIDIADQAAVTVGSVAGVTGITAAGAVHLTSTGGITLATPVSGAGDGDALILATGGGFTNAAGANALEVTSGGGRWLVFAQAPSQVTADGLAASPLYAHAFDFTSRSGGVIANAGDRFVYAIAPMLTVSPVSAVMTYDGAVPQTAVSITGLLAGDNLAQAVSGAAAVAGATGNAGSYVLTASLGTLASDYGYGFAFSTGTLTIQPKTVNWSVADASSTYGTLASLGKATLSGVLSGDDLSAAAVAFSGGAAVTLGPQTNVGITGFSGAGAVSGLVPVTLGPRTYAGSYMELVTGLSGAASGNYILALTGNTAGTLTIQPKPVSWSVADASSTYGTLASLGTATLAGVLSGDNLSAVAAAFSGGAAVTLGPRTDAGSYTERVTDLSGAASGNYTLAPAGNTAGTLTIQPKPVSWSVADASSTYGTLASLGSATLTGVLSGDVVGATVAAFLAGQPVDLTAVTSAGRYDELVTALAGAAAPNYRLASSGNVLGTLTISKPKPEPVPVPVPAKVVPGSVAPAPVAAPKGIVVPVAVPAIGLQPRPPAADGPARADADSAVVPAPDTAVPPQGVATAASVTAPASTQPAIASPAEGTSPAAAAPDAGSTQLASLPAPTEFSPAAPINEPSGEPAPASAAVASGDPQAVADGTAAAVQAFMDSGSGGVSKDTATATANQMASQTLAAGGSPEAAVAASAIALAQLKAAETGPPTPQQVLGEALAMGGMPSLLAGSGAAKVCGGSLSASLAGGASPEAALATAQACAAAAGAQMAAAQVPVGPGGDVAAAFSAGADMATSLAAAGDPATLAAALAAGGSPESASADAAVAKATQARMAEAAALPDTPERQTGEALAGGGPAAIATQSEANTALLAALASGETMDKALADATAASQATASMSAASDVPVSPSDRQSAELARGLVSAALNDCGIPNASDCWPAEAIARQTAAATVDGPNAPTAEALAAGRLPPALAGVAAGDAGVQRAVGDALARGNSLEQALADVAARRNGAAATARLAEIEPQGRDNILSKLATGGLRTPEVAALAGAMNPAFFIQRFIAALLGGQSVDAAIDQARMAGMADRRDQTLAQIQRSGPAATRVTATP